jgi:hypothetical protein
MKTILSDRQITTIKIVSILCIAIAPYIHIPIAVAKNSGPRITDVAIQGTQAQLPANPIALRALDVLRNESKGQINVVWGTRGFPTALHGELKKVSNTSEEALNFITEHQGLLSLQRARDLSLASTTKTPGGTQYRFGQNFNGVPVTNTEVVVNINPNGVLDVLSGQYFDISLGTISPRLTSDDSLQYLSTYLPLQSQQVQLNELCIVVDDNPREQGSELASLAYRIIVTGGNDSQSPGEWELYIDATDGRLIRGPLFLAEEYSEGYIYKNTSPMVYLNDPDFDHYASIVPISAYKSVELKDLYNDANLSGPYVDAYHLVSPEYSANPNDAGNYHFTHTNDPYDGAQRAKFGAVQAYYYIDFAQRYIRNVLGFNTIANYSIPVSFEWPKEDWEVGNAFFVPTIKKNQNTGFGKLWFSTNSVLAEDAEVILHEYSHALRYSQIPNAFTASAGEYDRVSAGTQGGGGKGIEYPEAGALSEGFADYLSTSLTSQFFGEAGTSFEDTQGEWAASAPDPEVPRSVKSSGSFPGGFVGLKHLDAPFWSSKLWHMRDAIGATQADRAVLQSHWYLGPYPTFLEASFAVISAAKNLGYTTAEQKLIRKSLWPVMNMSDHDFHESCVKYNTQIPPKPFLNYHIDTTFYAFQCDSNKKTSYENKPAETYSFFGYSGRPYIISAESLDVTLGMAISNENGSQMVDSGNNAGGAPYLYFVPTETGWFTVEVRALSVVGYSGPKYSLTVGDYGPERIRNGNFESGTSFWTEVPAGTIGHYTEWVPQEWRAFFSGDNATKRIIQSPKFSLLGTRVNLRFLLKIETSESEGAPAYDVLKVRITDSEGAVLEELKTFSNKDAGSFGLFKEVEALISPTLAKSGNLLEFYYHSDSTKNTTFSLDGVSTLNPH